MSTERLLFDVPGPRGRRRIRLATAVSAVVVAVLVAAGVRQFAINGQLDWDLWQPYTTWPMIRFLLQGLFGTAEAAVVAVALAMALGMLLALGRLSSRRVVRWPAYGYIELVRMIPGLLLIYVMLFALPQYGLRFPVYWELVIPLSVSNAAAFAVIFRTGILSLERGQAEAGLAVGLTYGQTMRFVVLPQAIRRLLPSIISQSVGLLKDTSMGFVVSYSELLYRGEIAANLTGHLIQAYIIVAVIYLVVNGALSRVAWTLEKRERAPVGDAASMQLGREAA
jgi:glutamate transport system permease protein